MIRAAVLLVLGSLLTRADTPIEVILAYYGLYFLLALPFSRLSARTLAVLAAAWALIGPQLLFLLVDPLSEGGWVAGFTAHDPLARLSHGDGVLQLFVTGSYPALAWMPFVLAGMAVGRLDLTSPAVRARLARSPRRSPSWASASPGSRSRWCRRPGPRRRGGRTPATTTPAPARPVC
ncbi:hypothetical protein NKH77_29435 [Streptomyces sp. M19]